MAVKYNIKEAVMSSIITHSNKQEAMSGLVRKCYSVAIIIYVVIAFMHNAMGHPILRFNPNWHPNPAMLPVALYLTYVAGKKIDVPIYLYGVIAAVSMLNFGGDLLQGAIKTSLILAIFSGLCSFLIKKGATKALFYLVATLLAAALVENFFLSAILCFGATYMLISSSPDNHFEANVLFSLSAILGGIFIKIWFIPINSINSQSAINSILAGVILISSMLIAEYAVKLRFKATVKSDNNSKKRR